MSPCETSTTSDCFSMEEDADCGPLEVGGWSLESRLEATKFSTQRLGGSEEYKERCVEVALSLRASELYPA